MTSTNTANNLQFYLQDPKEHNGWSALLHGPQCNPFIRHDFDTYFGINTCYFSHFIIFFFPRLYSYELGNKKLKQ